MQKRSTSASNPVSSRSSRRAASSTRSPGSTEPPGKHQYEVNGGSDRLKSNGFPSSLYTRIRATKRSSKLTSSSTSSMKQYKMRATFTHRMSYEDMLKDAREEIPEPKEAQDRFQVPDVSGRIEGGKTVITNFHEVADVLRRDPSHLLKYLNKELATAGKIDGREAVLQRRLRPNKLNAKIDDYKEMYVSCPSCGKADTTMESLGNSRYKLTCQACGEQNEFTGSI